MTTCLEKSCSFDLQCVSFVNVYQILCVLLSLLLVVVVLLFYVNGEHLKSCRDGQLT